MQWNAHGPTDARGAIAIKADIAPYLNREWQVELFNAPVSSPLECLFGGVCCCVAAAKQRHELLELTGEPYVCCAGMCEVGPLGEAQPEMPCLCCEVLFCPQLALSANRFFVQSRFGLQNTPADNALISATNWIGMLFNYCACFMEMKYCCQECFQIDIDGPCCDIQLPLRELALIADCAFLCLNGCMFAQQQVEIDTMKGRGYYGPPQAVLSALPARLQALMSSSRPPQQFMMS
mmetsp:Transcript_34616/g.79713  ORF Transcript_34616/g.79713 Transcript_34616/m.79713 type:complete len:235 (+) Transcript_34616:27-731(+)